MQNRSVGLAISNDLVKKLITIPKAISDRLMILKLLLNNKTFLNIISAYAPTLPSNEDIKHQFYEDFLRLLQGVSSW